MTAVRGKEVHAIELVGALRNREAVLRQMASASNKNARAREAAAAAALRIAAAAPGRDRGASE